MPIEIQILGQTHKSGGVKLINGIPTLSLLLMGCGNIDINNDKKKRTDSIPLQKTSHYYKNK